MGSKWTFERLLSHFYLSEWSAFFYRGPPLSQRESHPFPTHTILLPFVCLCILLLSQIRLFATQWIVAHKVLLSMEFSRQEYWSKLPFPPPGDLPDRIKLTSPVSLILARRFFPAKPPGKPWKMISLKTLSLLYIFFLCLKCFFPHPHMWHTLIKNLLCSRPWADSWENSFDKVH